MNILLIVIIIILIYNLYINYKWRKRQNKINAAVIENLEQQELFNIDVANNVKMKSEVLKLFLKILKDKK